MKVGIALLNEPLQDMPVMCIGVEELVDLDLDGFGKTRDFRASVNHRYFGFAILDFGLVKMGIMGRMGLMSVMVFILFDFSFS